MVNYTICYYHVVDGVRWGFIVYTSYSNSQKTFTKRLDHTMRRVTIVILIACFMLQVRSAVAQISATWVGPNISNSYSDPLNWDISAVPINTTGSGGPVEYDVTMSSFDVVLPLLPSEVATVNSFAVSGGAASLEIVGGGTYQAESTSDLDRGTIEIDNGTLVVGTLSGFNTKLLKVSDGGRVFVRSSGRYEGGLSIYDGHFTATGGSVLVRSNVPLVIGFGQSDGPGELILTNGATFDASVSQILVGSDTLDPSILRIAGQNTTFTGDRQIQVGAGANGSLLIENGGFLSTAKGTSSSGSSGLIGSQGAGTGTATVTGVGSQWTQDGGLSVGFSAVGSMSILDGGFVESLEGFIGRRSGSNGFTTIGQNSTWNVLQTLFIGGDSTGSNAPGELALEGGSVAIGDHLQVWETGVLSGEGTVTGDLVNVGQIAPGFSPGVIQIDGEFSQQALGNLSIEIEGLSPGNQHDQLVISGNATLSGTLSIDLVNGFSPQLGDTFQVLAAANVFNAFDTVELPVLSGLGWEVNYNASEVLLEVILGTSTPGDFDGDVDGADFLTWQVGFPTAPHDAAGYALWESNYGFGSGPGNGSLSGSSTVPEPSAVLLLLVTFLVCLSAKRSNSNCRNT